MTSLRDHANSVRRYLLGTTDYSPRLENVARRVLNGWVSQVEDGHRANGARKTVADARAIQIRRAVDAEVVKKVTRTVARRRVATARAKAGLPVASFATVRNADKHAAKLLRTGTPAKDS